MKIRMERLRYANSSGKMEGRQQAVIRYNAVQEFPAGNYGLAAVKVES
jgi:hypothetical protein